MKQETVQKKVGDVMGGKVLDLPEFRIYDQGKEEGRKEGIEEGIKEGESERNALKQENERLRKEIEQLKAAMNN